MRPPLKRLGSEVQMLAALLISWIPALTVWLALAIQELALPWQTWSFFRPDLVMIALFYWRLFRPDRCGFGVAFSAGLVLDLLSGGLPGLNALTKIGTLLLVDAYGQRLRTVDFVLLPLVLIVLLLLESLIQWGLLGLLSVPTPHWPMILGKPAATALLTPLVAAMLIHIHRNWLEARD
ncbi:MAG: rod shape-determining protein MreD [Magnetococcales bacterium]|nr:rod shape-determining protein MreD [Magnetococcales bacterium]